MSISDTLKSLVDGRAILGTYCWWRGNPDNHADSVIVTQTCLYEGETFEQAKRRAHDNFRLLNPGKWPNLDHAYHRFYPIGT